MEEQNTKKFKLLQSNVFIYSIKLLVSVLAILFLISTVGSKELIRSVSSFGFVSLLLAALIYLLSQWVSSYRLRRLLHTISVSISALENFKLYLIGMSYNLFLPTGIGGDAYKFLILKNTYSAPQKSTLQALLVDRLYGLMAIFLLLGGVAFVHIDLLPFYIHPVLVILILPLIFGAGYLVFKKMFSLFHRSYWVAVMLSLVIQSIQVAMVCFIATMFGVKEPTLVAGVFLVSTLATTIPVFLGGVGARELVFAYFAETLQISSSVAVGIALIFSVCTIINAIPGLFLDWFSKRK